jgi:glycerate kinase
MESQLHDTKSACCVVVAPDKFKGSLSAAQAAAAITRGITRRDPNIRTVECPVADGGEGTLAAALSAGFDRVPVVAPGPTGAPIDTSYARKGELAVVEMADVAGLARLPAGLPHPLTASSRGLGTVVCRALDDGCRRIVVGIGGSACTDGGAGFLQGLGAELRGADGRLVSDGGGSLGWAFSLNLSGLHPALRDAEIVIASDVDNPLCGPDGAASVYGPQKGASPVDVRTLDAALSHWADLVADTTGRDVRSEPGAGAAGGVGFAASALLGAQSRPGIDLVLDLVGIDEHLDHATAVITGEGSLDGQSLNGKAPVGVCLRASRHNIPTHAIVGVSRLSPQEMRGSGFSSVYALRDREPDVRRSMAHAADLIASVAEDLATEQLVAQLRS